jgi:hypothetical protein
VATGSQSNRQVFHNISVLPWRSNEKFHEILISIVYHIPLATVQNRGLSVLKDCALRVAGARLGLASEAYGASRKTFPNPPAR